MEPPEKRVCYEVDSVDLDEDSSEKQTGWFDLPYEMRSMVLDMVPIKPLLRFGECSKQCYEEVSKSKNYFKDITLIEKPRYFQLSLEPWFSLQFWKNDSQTVIVCSSLSEGYVRRGEKAFIWRECVDDHPVYLFLKYFRDYSRKIGQHLKTLHIIVSNQMRNRMVRRVELRNLRKLECLQIEPTISQICPIKYGFLDFDTVKNVTEDLKIPGAQIDFQQLVQLKADYIEIYYMGLSATDLIEYIKLWRDGKLHRNFRQLKIHAGYNEKHAKKRIVLDMDGLECENLYESGPDVSFTIRSSCQWLKDDLAYVDVENNGMLFNMFIE